MRWHLIEYFDSSRNRVIRCRSVCGTKRLIHLSLFRSMNVYLTREARYEQKHHSPWKFLPFVPILSKIRIFWCISRNVFNILFNECSFSGSWIVKWWQTDRQAYIVKLFYIFLQMLLWICQELAYSEPTVQIDCESLAERVSASRNVCMYLNRF
jgi:hypothetical protein